MSHLDYLAYLESPEWWAVCKQVRQRAGNRCERCGGCGPFEIHHLTYVRLGQESADDVQLLCIACHRNERLPRNRKLRALEQYGQVRLFDRWDDDDPDPATTAKAA